MGILPDVITQHAEGAAFLWLLRDAAVDAPNYRLADLTGLEARIESHLDGLRIGGEEGWAVAKEALAPLEAGEVFVTTVLAAESGDEARVAEAMAAGVASLAAVRGLVSALGWLPFAQASPVIQRLAAEKAPIMQRAAIGALAAHRRHPGTLLRDAIASDDPTLAARALKAVGELGRKDFAPAVETQLGAKDEGVRFAAAWSGTLLGIEKAVAVLIELAGKGAPRAEKAATLAFRRMASSEAAKVVNRLGGSPATSRAALKGAGALGDPAAIPWLIDRMQVPELARPAGEAFTMITGVDLELQTLAGKHPEGFHSGPTESPEDENVAMDPDEDLPWPDQKRVFAWWKGNQPNLKNGVRHLLGKPIAPEWLAHVLANGFQRQRAAAAFELALLRPGRPLFHVRAPGARQIGELSAHRGA